MLFSLFLIYYIQKQDTRRERAMAMGRFVAFCLAAFLLAGCAASKPELYHSRISKGPLLREQVFYTQVKTSSGATMGAIYHINAQGKATLLATNVDEAFWKKFVLMLTGAVGQVGAAAIHGISFPAAKTAINAAATNTNSNTATGGKVCTESGAGDVTGC